MVQVSEMLFKFQMGNAAGSYKSGKLQDSTKSNGFSFQRDFDAAAGNAAKTIRRLDDSRKSDYRNEASQPLYKVSSNDAKKAVKADDGSSKKVDERSEEEQTDKKAKEPDKKTAEDIADLMNLLNSILSSQQQNVTEGQSENEEALAAVKELADALKNQNLTMTDETKQNIGKLLDMLKEMMSNTQETGNAVFSSADANQQVKDLISELLQAQSGTGDNTTTDQLSGEDQTGLVENVKTNTANAPVQTLYKLNKQDYETKNPGSTTESKDGSVEANAAAQEAAKADAEKIGDKAEPDVKKQAAEDSKAVKPDEKAAVGKAVQEQAKAVQKEDQVPQKAAEAEKKDADKEGAGETKAAAPEDTKKTVVLEKSDSKKAGMGNTTQNSNISKNGQLQEDKQFVKVMETVKTEKPQVVSKQDVINQIIKKAEVTVGDKQSEMNMQLEPENLGKLTLKIAVERGVVTAKFVAESQQVKEIIETNFNQLKDALQEKGIAVQSFSVSVGQDDSSSNNGNYSQWKQSMRSNSKDYAAVNYTEAAGDYDAKTINPYSYHEGKIDFRA